MLSSTAHAPIPPRALADVAGDEPDGEADGREDDEQDDDDDGDDDVALDHFGGLWGRSKGC